MPYELFQVTAWESVFKQAGVICQYAGILDVVQGLGYMVGSRLNQTKLLIHTTRSGI